MCTRNKTRNSTLALGLIAIALIALLPDGPVQTSAAPALTSKPFLAAELHVCHSGCTYSSIQAAVDAANDGDVIKVATGTYTGISVRSSITQVVYISKTVTLRGGYTVTNWTVSYPISWPTTLDAQGQGRVFYVTGNITPTLEGLRITGGDATGLGGPLGDSGGGIYVAKATATISNCTVLSNTADYGGGLYLAANAAKLSANTIAINSAQYGGGLCLDNSDATLTTNTVVSNTAGLRGGGLYLSYSNATLKANSVISNNTAQYGGGLHLGNSPARLSRNTISANTATGRGGGMHLAYSDATLDNNFITDNALTGGGNGSGLYVFESSPYLRHNTVARNVGGGGEGLYITDEGVPNHAQLYNTILVSQTVGIRVTSNSHAYLEGTLWGAGLWANGVDRDNLGSGSITTGTVSLWGDPAFVNYIAGDYHITVASAAKDAGVYSILDNDVDGDPRPMGFAPDIGADEIPVPALQLRETAGQTAVNPGQVITYALVVTSTGGTASNGVFLTDTLPVHQRAISVTFNRGDCRASAGWGENITCTLGAMNVGETALITLTAQVTNVSVVPLPYPMRNTALVWSDGVAGATYLDIALQDCHVRLNDDSMEWNNVQAAVDASKDPTDVVKVAGICAHINARDGARQIVYLTKTIRIQGGYTTIFAGPSRPDIYPTVLDAWGQGRVFYIAGGISPIIEGLRITGGDAAGLGGTQGDSGGGFYVARAAPFINHCTISSNTASYGGGLYLETSAARLTANLVIANSAHHGAGLYLDNSAAKLNANTINANIATGHGAGAYLSRSDALLDNSFIADNILASEGNGSGLYVFESNPHLRHTTIARNAGGDGSGLYATGSGSTYSTIAMTNTILASQTVGLIVTSGSTATLEATLWGSGAWANQFGWGGTGYIAIGTINLSGNPAFLDPGEGNYRIGSASAAIDVGVNAGVSDDVDGDNRPFDGDRDGLAAFDIGADELVPHLDVTKYATPDPVQAGTLLTYTIHMTNTGNVDLHAIVTDVLPVHATPTGTITWMPIITAPGGIWTQQAIVTVETGYRGVLTNVVEVITEEGATGVYTETSATVMPAMQVIKQATPDLVQAGAVLTYTIRVTNAGNVALHAVVADTLPAQVTPSGLLTWTPVITPGDTWTQTLGVTVAMAYSGTLTNVVEVTSEEGAKDAFTQVTTVTLSPLGIEFVANPTSGVRPLTVAFTVITTKTLDSWLWDFGDGVTSTLQSPTHIYRTAGVYTVTLTTSESGRIVSLARPNYITVYEPVTATFTAVPTSGVLPLLVTFANGSTGDYTDSLWDFGDSVTSILHNPIHTYVAAGVYTASLTVSGPGGTASFARTNYITVHEPTIAAFTAVPTSGVRPLTVTFTAISTSTLDSWLWDFGDGVTSTLQSPTHIYRTAGVYTVTLIVGGPGMTASLARSNYIMVYEPVAAAFAAAPTSGVAPLRVTFANGSTGGYTDSLWDFGDSVTSMLPNPTHTYMAVGVYTVSLTVSGPGGTASFARPSYITVYKFPTVYLPIVLKSWPPEPMTLYLHMDNNESFLNPVRHDGTYVSFEFSSSSGWQMALDRDLGGSMYSYSLYASKPPNFEGGVICDVEILLRRGSNDIPLALWLQAFTTPDSDQVMLYSDTIAGVDPNVQPGDRLILRIHPRDGALRIWMGEQAGNGGYSYIRVPGYIP